MYFSFWINRPGFPRIALTALCLRCLLGAIVLMLFHCPAVLSQPSGNGGPSIGPAQPQAPANQEELLELRKLAEQAKNSFRQEIEPPPKPGLNIFAALRLEGTYAYRDYAMVSFESAIDALLAEAVTPDRLALVKNALLELVDKGKATTAEAIFAEILQRREAEAIHPNREAAASARHGAALALLPSALEPLFEANEMTPFTPMAAKAAYRRAAELEPDHAWTWIMLALFQRNNAELFEAGLKRAEIAARSTGDLHASIIAKRELGGLAKSRGRQEEAEQFYRDALAIARLNAAQEPANPIKKRDLAVSLVVLGLLKENQGNYGEAEPFYREAHDLRKISAAAEPNDSQRQMELIAANLEMTDFLLHAGRKPEAREYRDEAFRIYNVIAPNKWKPMVDMHTVGGMSITILIYAVGCTLIFGLVLLAFYRRRLASLMKLASSALIHTPIAPPLPRDGAAGAKPGALSIHTIDAKKEPPGRAYRSGPIAGVASALRNAGWIYASAGLAFAIVAGILDSSLSDKEFLFRRIIGVTWIWAWPVVLTLGLLWGPDRKRGGLAVLGYFVVLLAWSLPLVHSKTAGYEVFGIHIVPVFVPLYGWIIMGLPTTLFMLLLYNRSIRSIGLLVFVFVIVAGIGGGAAYILSTMPIVSRLTVWLLNRALNLPVKANYYIYWLAGMVVFAPLGWLAIVRIRRRYQAKRLSDQTLVIDSLWLFHTLYVGSFLDNFAGLLGWLAGLGAFSAYKLVTWVGLRPIARAASAQQPARLLLLRVFGFRRRTERFFDLLSARWRYAGPIELISAPDLAGHSMDPGKFMDFLSGKLRRRFIIEPADIERGFAEADDRPDPDGRYRVNEFFCGNDAWRPVVQRLMSRNDLVVMDLRGFTPGNQGCLFEMHSLIGLVPVARIVLLVDQTTDVPLLRKTVAGQWRHREATSPNRDADGSLILLDVGGREIAALEWLFAIADEILSKPNLHCQSGNLGS